MSPKTVFHREKYLKAVKPYIGKQLIKVFTGQRRVGKSYLIFQIIEVIKKASEKANIIYINKEELEFDFVKDHMDLYEYVISQKVESAQNYVFIDEIQDISGFEKALRSFVLDESLDLYCTGSNANLLSGEFANFLSGRYIEINVHSLSYQEFLQFHHLKNDEGALKKYLKYGGLPYLIHLPLQDEVVFDYLKNIYTTIIYRDIVERYALRNVRFLEKLTLFLAGNIGSLFSAKKISDFLKSQQVKISTNQVLTYVQYLKNAFIVYEVPRYDVLGKRVFEIGDKYYFENLGIRNALWGFRLEDQGKILENAVYNHLIFLSYQVKVGVLNKEEVDFVAEKAGEILYIQVALRLDEEKTIEMEFGNLLKIQDNYPKYVVTRDGFEGNTYKGIPAISLMEFLLWGK
ncbi:ATP-binding protein [Cytophagaceae bacterium ABcell3]|nr:ATP-binding protein [Cytophagaceae bacterium ABcell3]